MRVSIDTFPGVYASMEIQIQTHTKDTAHTIVIYETMYIYIYHIFYHIKLDLYEFEIMHTYSMVNNPYLTKKSFTDLGVTRVLHMLASSSLLTQASLGYIPFDIARACMNAEAHCKFSIEAHFTLK